VLVLHVVFYHGTIVRREKQQGTTKQSTGLMKYISM
jgi:hypothetical protein